MDEGRFDPSFRAVLSKTLTSLDDIRTPIKDRQTSCRAVAASARTLGPKPIKHFDCSGLTCLSVSSELLLTGDGFLGCPCLLL